MIGEVVGDHQFAFISRRQLLDSVLIMNEMVDCMNENREGGLLFKVDFKKAYDNVSWEFLELVMVNMGFGRRWCKWIMECVTTASASVLVNGFSTKTIKL